MGPRIGRAAGAVMLLVPPLLLLFASSPSTSPLATWHNYSIAIESTSGSFTGVASTRQDVPVGSQPSTGCDATYFSGNPVYQTQWVDDADGANWLELGTGHQCADTKRYWYWGYALGGVWYPLGEQAGVVNGDTHTFRISEAFNGTATVVLWQVDGTTKASISSSATYVRVDAGLESYAPPPAYVNSFTVSGLGAQRNGGSFVSWSGEDSSSVTVSGMCGKWISPTAWSAAESNPCL